MNNTEIIRNYLNRNKGGFFEITYELKNRFSMLKPKTVMTILRRLEPKGLVTNIGKGVYFINDEYEYSESRLVNYYTSDHKGVVNGYYLMNKYKISNHKEPKAIVYTNRVGINKTVGNIKFIKAGIEFIGVYQIMMIQLLSILEHGNIIDCNVDEYLKTIQGFLYSYNDRVFEEVVSAIKFKRETIAKLEEMLNSASIKNNCRDIFLKYVIE